MPPEPAPAYQMDFFRALLCRPHRHGIFGRDRCRDLDEGALSNDGAKRLDSVEIRDVGFGMQAAHATSERPVQMLLRCSDRHQGHEPARPRRTHGSCMKFVEPSSFLDPDATARKVVEIANAIEPAQDGRIYIELLNGAFLKAGGRPGSVSRRNRARD
jgi:hypothetical protein